MTRFVFSLFWGLFGKFWGRPLRRANKSAGSVFGGFQSTPKPSLLCYDCTTSTATALLDYYLLLYYCTTTVPLLYYYCTTTVLLLFY